jgi:ABC-type transport system involved in Fe-S cluster assembly fused permease/ATPase subunit
MATAKQKAAARRNIKKAAKAARRKKTIARLPKKTRTALGKQGAKIARQKRRSGKNAD